MLTMAIARPGLAALLALLMFVIIPVAVLLTHDRGSTGPQHVTTPDRSACAMFCGEAEWTVPGGDR